MKIIIKYIVYDDDDRYLFRHSNIIFLRMLERKKTIKNENKNMR